MSLLYLSWVITSGYSSCSSSVQTDVFSSSSDDRVLGLMRHRMRSVQAGFLFLPLLNAKCWHHRHTVHHMSWSNSPCLYRTQEVEMYCKSKYTYHNQHKQQKCQEYITASGLNSHTTGNKYILQVLVVCWVDDEGVPGWNVFWLLVLLYSPVSPVNWVVIRCMITEERAFLWRHPPWWV